VSGSLYIDRAGPDHGQVLLLQHGFAGSARNWRPQMRALREQVRVVAFDARGHARSANRIATARFGLDDFVRDFSDVADLVSPSAPLIAGGLSLGASVALHFALSAPQRVAGLVLAAVPPGAGQGFGAVAGEFADALERDGSEAAGERFVWGAASGLDPAAARLVRQGFLEHPASALAQILRQTLASLPTIESLAPRLAELDVPTLVLVGSDDRGSLEPCRRLAEALPNACKVEIPQAGHVVNLAAPGEFNDALRSFVGQIG